MLELEYKFYGVSIVKNIKYAFTLAELLIAMLIFALLAVMLVPNVTNNAEKELFSTQIMKVQNDIQQAMLMMLTQNQGSLRMLCAGGATPAEKNKCFVNEMAKRLEKTVVYTNTDATSCSTQNYADKKSEKAQACQFQERKPQYQNKSDAELKVNGGAGWEQAFSAVNLKNGASVAAVFDPNCNKGTTASGENVTDWVINDVVDTVGIRPANICGYIEIDVNAGKVPNVVGKDIHYFWIVDQDGIIPFGEVDIFSCGVVSTAEGSKGKITTAPKDSRVTNEQLGCTSRIMQRGKIDYY